MINMNPSGTPKEASVIHVNPSGTPKEVTEIWVNPNGTPYQVWPMGKLYKDNKYQGEWRNGVFTGTYTYTYGESTDYVTRPSDFSGAKPAPLYFSVERFTSTSVSYEQGIVGQKAVNLGRYSKLTVDWLCHPTGLNVGNPEIQDGTQIFECSCRPIVYLFTTGNVLSQKFLGTDLSNGTELGSADKAGKLEVDLSGITGTFFIGVTMNMRRSSTNDNHYKYGYATIKDIILDT